jgi:DNA repair photolyase
MNIPSVPAKSFMTPTKLGADFTCNPYRGCTHACAYCYVKTLPGYASESRTWGTYVEHRKFESYAIKRGTGSKRLMFSSATDAYQPVEKIVRETRTVLEAIVEADLTVSILTKSDLVLRDLDLFSRMKNVEIGMSIAVEDADAAWLEPGATPPSKRLEALKILKAAGIRTYAFVSPIIPGITDVKSWTLRLKDAVDYLMFDRLNVSDPRNHLAIRRAIEQNRPDILSLFDRSMQKSRAVYEELRNQIVELCAEAGIPLGYLYPGGTL